MCDCCGECTLHSWSAFKPPCATCCCRDGCHSRRNHRWREPVKQLFQRNLEQRLVPPSGHPGVHLEQGLITPRSCGPEHPFQHHEQDVLVGKMYA